MTDLLMSYEAVHAELDRIEAALAADLPELPHWNYTIRARAQRLLECDKPPIGEDRDFCYRVLSGNIIAG